MSEAKYRRFGIFRRSGDWTPAYVALQTEGEWLVVAIGDVTNTPCAHLLVEVANDYLDLYTLPFRSRVRRLLWDRAERQRLLERLVVE